MSRYLDESEDLYDQEEKLASNPRTSNRYVHRVNPYIQLGDQEVDSDEFKHEAVGGRSYGKRSRYDVGADAADLSKRLKDSRGGIRFTHPAPRESADDGSATSSHGAPGNNYVSKSRPPLALDTPIHCLI